MNEELDLLDLLQTFWKKKWWLVASIVIGVVIGWFYTSYMVTPKYTSSVTLILSKPTTESTDSEFSNAITQSDIALNQKLISTYGEIMKSKRISNKVIENLNLDMSYDELKPCINVSAVEDTDVIKLSITTEEPYLSAKIATEMTNVFTEAIVKIYNIQNVSLIDEAEVDQEPVNVNMLKNIIIFASIMFILVSLVIFLIYYFDNTIKNAEDVSKLTGLPVLSSIPLIVEMNGGKKKNA